jgi:hypothetical protein
VVDAAEERELRDPDAARDLDLVVGVAREGDHAVYVGGLQARVVQCVERRLAR